MSEVKVLREPTCYNCPHRVHYGGDVPMKKYGVMMRLGDVFCVFGKKAQRFKKSDPKFKVPQWCPRRLPARKLRMSRILTRRPPKSAPATRTEETGWVNERLYSRPDD